jgi:hypothetical protein
MRKSSRIFQRGLPLAGKRVLLGFASLVVAMAVTMSARAETNVVSDALQSGVSAYVQAAVAAKGGDLSGVTAALSDVQGFLNQAKAGLASAPELDPVTFGKKLDSALKKLLGVQAYFDKGAGNATSRVNKLASAAKSLQKLANTAGMPMLVEVNAKTAGFHKVGEIVPMAFAIPAGCNDWHINYTELESGVIADFTVDYATGEILVTMGSVGGSARVTVTGCGLPPEGKSWLLYNYGPKPISGLPEGFPTNLANGNYAMSYSGSVSCTSGGGYNFPPTALGTFALSGNLKAFYNSFKTAMDAAVAAVSQPGCTQSVTYSPFNGSSFHCTLKVSCTSCGANGCVTCTSTLVFTFTKI